MNIKKDKILVVEDEVLIAKDIAEILKEVGYDVVDCVLSGEEAIRKCEELKPHLVLMDIKLQGKMSGIDAAETILKKYNIPVIYLTAYSSSSDLQKAKKTNPYGYIVKPFDKINLYTSIEIALSKYRNEKKVITDTDNAIATILGCSQLLLEEFKNSTNPEIIMKIMMIRKSASFIKENIEEL